ncbi:MAG: DUF2330 domain-containing protein [Armatimonadetes bacterium]|nr:DUF2330 domain-containing protein [Armatimonadota bacterium]
MGVRRGAWWLLLVVGAAWGDGMLVPLRMTTALPGGAQPVLETAQTAWIQWESGTETLTVAIAHRGSARGFCWLLPVPGQPQDSDISVADPAQLKAAFARSAQRERLIESGVLAQTGPLAFLDFMPSPNISRGPAEPPPSLTKVTSAPEVRLLSQGQHLRYEVSVLTSRTGAALVEWLGGAGFEAPRDLAREAATYSGSGHSFVAVRIPPEHAATPGALPPLSIRFATPQPYFPLRISRLSGSPRTLLRLLVTASEPMALATSLHSEKSPAGGGQPPGLAMVAAWRDPASGAWDSRYHGVVTLDQMVDLRFEPVEPSLVRRYDPSGLRSAQGAHDYHYREPLTAARLLTGQVGMMLLCWWLACGWLVARERWRWGVSLGWSLVAVATLLFTCQALGAVAMVAMALGGLFGLLALWPLLLLAVVLAPGGPRAALTNAAVLTVCIVAAWIDGTLLGPIPLAGLLKLPGALLLPLLLASTLLDRGSERWPGWPRWAFQAAPAIALVAMILIRILAPQSSYWLTAGLAVGVVLARLANRRMWDEERLADTTVSLRAASRAMLVTMVVAAAILAASPWFAPRLRQVPRQYVERRQALLDALGRFQADSGLLPASLEDLTRRAAPAAALDAAGQRVDWHGDWRGPYLRQVPANPVTRDHRWR